MTRNDDELMERLKKMKVKQTLDSEKKELMKMKIQKHARKKQRSAKRRSWFVWLAASAIILISGVLLYPVIIDDTALPSDENQQSDSGEHVTEPSPNQDPDAYGGASDSDSSTDEEDNEESEESEDIRVEELGEESYELMVEGMEETSTLYQFRFEPYGIEYEIDELLRSYTIVEDSVQHHLEDTDGASIRLSVKENNSIEEVAEKLAEDYHEKYEDVSEMEQPEDVDSPYSGLRQSALDTSGNEFDSFVGYYVFQVEKDVVLIEYEYMVEAGDGIGPRLQALVESLEV